MFSGREEGSDTGSEVCTVTGRVWRKRERERKRKSYDDGGDDGDNNLGLLLQRNFWHC